MSSFAVLFWCLAAEWSNLCSYGIQRPVLWWPLATHPRPYSLPAWTGGRVHCADTETAWWAAQDTWLLSSIVANQLLPSTWQEKIVGQIKTTCSPGMARCALGLSMTGSSIWSLYLVHHHACEHSPAECYWIKCLVFVKWFEIHRLKTTNT